MERQGKGSPATHINAQQRKINMSTKQWNEREEMSE
jgi:hypothetical protein